MIEPEAVIDPEAPAPAPHPGRRRRAVLAGATALALVAGGITLAAGGGPEPAPLALMAGAGSGDGATARAETTSGGAALAAAPAIGTAADSLLAYPYGGWGLEFEVAGDLPDLPDRAPVWRAGGPDLDRGAVARIAGALGVSGVPEQREGGWSVESDGWTLNAFPGGDAWSVNLFRNAVPGGGDAAVTGDTPTGPSLSPAEAEQRVRGLLAGMGAPAGTWGFETTETEIGLNWVCAAPVPETSPEELRRLETEKLRRLEPGEAADSASDARPVPADQPATDVAAASCPPPPPPVEGFDVALYPMLDGVRADWPVWHVTLRSDGGIESLSGSWMTFERGGDYRLRGVEAALEELQSPPGQPLRGEGDVADDSGNAPPVADDTPAVAVETSAAVEGTAAGSSGAGAAGSSGPTPDAPPPDRGLPAPPTPTAVTITGVEPALMQAPVFEDGRARLHLVPAYRFVGGFADGQRWETLVVALHSDAIAPPPDMPVTDLRSGGAAGPGPLRRGEAVPGQDRLALRSEDVVQEGPGENGVARLR